VDPHIKNIKVEYEMGGPRAGVDALEKR